MITINDIDNNKNYKRNNIININHNNNNQITYTNIYNNTNNKQGN